MTILVDMDEVLADFATAAACIHCWTRQQLEAVWPPGRWSIVEPMGLILETFWTRINAAGERFWVELAPLPWATELISLLNTEGYVWYVCSSPSRDPSSYSGKVKWLQRYLASPNRPFTRFVLTNHKHLLARPDTVLIDDNAATCREFEAAGGRAIIFPSRHNSLHPLAADPVAYVREQLRCISTSTVSTTPSAG